MDNSSNALQRLKGLRNELGISDMEMAAAADMEVGKYLEIENGVADVSFTFFFKCAAKLGVDLSDRKTTRLNSSH